MTLAGASLLLTIIFIVLKVTAVVTFSWLWAFFPLIVGVSLTLLFTLAYVGLRNYSLKSPWEKKGGWKDGY